MRAREGEARGVRRRVRLAPEHKRWNAAGQTLRRGAGRSKLSVLLGFSLLLALAGSLSPEGARGADERREASGNTASAPLRIGTSADYAPFSVEHAASPDGLDGFDVALARALAADLGRRPEWVRFRWPELLRDLAAGRFDVAMSGVTVRPERSAAGRFSVPVAVSGAVVLTPGDRADLDALDRAEVEIAVNAGGHLERVTRARFAAARVRAVGRNADVLAALDDGADAVVTDSLEAPHWLRLRPGLRASAPFTRDRKAYLLPADAAALAAEIDGWLLAREADGRLGGWRARYLATRDAPRTATPLAALLAAVDERLALMPAVAAAKRARGLAIEVPEVERRVVAAGVAAVAAEAARVDAPAPDATAVAALYRSLIEAAKAVQRVAIAQAPRADTGAGPALDLESEIRPALLRIGEKIARLVVALSAADPAPDTAAIERDASEALASHRLAPDRVDALVRALVALGESRRASQLPRESARTARPARIGSAAQASQRNSAKRSPRIGTSHATKRWIASSDQLARKATMAAWAAPARSMPAAIGIDTNGPDGVIMPAAAAMAMPRTPASSPSVLRTHSVGISFSASPAAMNDTTITRP